MLYRARTIVLLAALACCLWAANPELAQVQTVYLLPMSNGLDQYLAGRLTAAKIYQITTDPKRADAVLTDQVGGAFEERLTELYPPPPEPEPEAKDAKDEKGGEKKAEDPSGRAFKGDTGTPRSMFSRGRGNLFLVDLKSRRVLWSIYERPKSAIPDDLDRSSRRIVSELKKALEGK